MEHDLLVDVTVEVLALGEQQLCCSSTQEFARLADGAEWYRRRAGECNVVITDDGEIAGHIRSRSRHLLEQAES